MTTHINACDPNEPEFDLASANRLGYVGNFISDEARRTQAFRTACDVSKVSSGPLPVVHAHRQWIDIEFGDFYSTSGELDIRDYLDALALKAHTLCRLFEEHLPTPAKHCELARQLLLIAIEFNVPGVWHKQFRLRPYIDASHRARLLGGFSKFFFNCSVYPEVEPRRFYQLLVDQAAEMSVKDAYGQYASLRSALIVKAEWELSRDYIDLAIETATTARGLLGSCFTSENLLLRIWQAKRKKHPETTLPTDIAIESLEGRFCSMPFEALVSGGGGQTHLCNCPSLVPFEVGNVLSGQSIDEIWNSDASAEIRRSILDGDFSYCSRTLCPSIISRTLPMKSEVTDPFMRSYIDNRVTKLQEGPRQVQLSYDPTCNIACPSCRVDLIVAKGREQDIYAAARDRTILPLLRKTSGTVLITGGGDPFASRHWRSVLSMLNRKDYPDLHLNILTNGLLLNETQWNQFPCLGEMINTLQVSVDAATPETYAKVRRPGNWDELKPNLIYLSGLRQRGAFKSFGINFVVQHDNFRELPDFVKLGLELRVDFILLQRMFNFGSFTQEEFVQKDICSSVHPDHGELLSILGHPIMQREIVRAFNLSSLFPSAEAK